MEDIEIMVAKHVSDDGNYGYLNKFVGRVHGKIEEIEYRMMKG